MRHPHQAIAVSTAVWTRPGESGDQAGRQVGPPVLCARTPRARLAGGRRVNRVSRETLGVPALIYGSAPFRTPLGHAPTAGVVAQVNPARIVALVDHGENDDP